jgi:hypothetical protein
MYVRELNCLFLHVPKTAGSAVECWLAGAQLNDGMADYERLFGFEPGRDLNLHHATPTLAREIIGPVAFDNSFRFAVVRNPYARAISAYFYNYDQLQRRHGDFDDYIPGLAGHHRQRESDHTPSRTAVAADLLHPPGRQTLLPRPRPF